MWRLCKHKKKSTKAKREKLQQWLETDKRKRMRKRRRWRRKKEEETMVEDEGMTPWSATCVGNLLLQLGAAPTALSSSSLFIFFLLQIRNLWNEEEDDKERDEIILVLVIYGFGLCWVCILFEEIYGTRRKMTKREMGNYFGFGFGLCSYVLFWFVLGLWYRGRSEEKGFFWEEMTEHRVRERQSIGRQSIVKEKG